MTNEQRQRLSELLDGELDAGAATRLLDSAAEDSELRTTWERYHLIGQAIRGETIDLSQRAIADQVRVRVADEPAILAPSPRRRAAPRGFRRVAGIAMAASVALAALVAAPVLFQSADPESRGSAEPPRLVERESIPMRQLQLERPELASKLDLYLVTHQATAPATGAKGMLPYATLVGYEAPR